MLREKTPDKQSFGKKRVANSAKCRGEVGIS